MLTEEEIKQIYYNEYVGQHLGTYTLKKKYHCHIYDQFKKYGLPIRNNREKNKKYSCDIDYFSNIDTPEKAYWLGFIFADGFIGKNNSSERFGISLSKVDEEHLYKFKNAINSTHPIRTYKVSNGYKVGVDYCRIIIAEKKIVDDLIKQGCVYHKTDILEPPNIPKILRRHWIRGYMDGDGSIIVHNTKHGDAYSIGFTGTDDVLNWIMDELIDDKILNRRYPITKRRKGQIVSNISFGGNYLVKNYLDYIYKDASVYLQRKYDRYVNLCNMLNTRELSKVEYTCDICGSSMGHNYLMWNGEGQYKDMKLCRRHWQQLYRHGKILQDKNNCCDICGDSYGKLIQCKDKYMDYYGLTMCKKHYQQLYVYGKITDTNKGRHKYE